jgi:hypothetical protein
VRAARAFPRSFRSRGRWIIAALGVVAGLLPAHARGEEAAPEPGAFKRIIEQTDIGASIRGSYWSSSRELNNQANLGVAALWLHGRSQLASSVAIAADGWLMNDDLFSPGATRAQLREGYLDLRFGSLDFRVGQQIIAWGRADRINPTDNLTSRDFTLLVPEDGDQRTGTVGIKGTYHWGGTSFIGVWLPTFQSDIIPIQIPPDPFVLLPRQLPNEPVSQFAFKIDRSGGPLDWSLSYFNGYDLYPDLEIVGFTLTKVNVAPTYHKIQVVGADAATVWGPYGFRAEMAYTFTDHSNNPQVKSPFFFMVLGADRTFLGSLNVNLQFILRVISDFVDPNSVPNPAARAVAIEQATINSQLDQVQESISLRINKKWLNETLETEVASVFGIVRGDYAVRPKAKYAITDRLRATVGGDIFRGPTPSFFGRIRDNSTAYVELRWDY